MFSVGDGVRGVRRGEAELAFALPWKCRAALSDKNRRHLVDACEGEHRRLVHTIFPVLLFCLASIRRFIRRFVLSDSNLRGIDHLR